MGSLAELNGDPSRTASCCPSPHPPILIVPFAQSMAAQAAALSQPRMERRGKGRKHFTRTQDEPLVLLGISQPQPGLRARREGEGRERSRSPSAAAHKALHLLLASQAPPWATFFRGSRMPPSVVGGTVRLPLAALPLPSLLSRFLPTPRHRPRRELCPVSGPQKQPTAPGVPAPRGSGQRSSLRGTSSPSGSATRSWAHTPSPQCSGRVPIGRIPRRRGSPAAATLLPARRRARPGARAPRAPARAPRRGASALVRRRRQLQRPLAGRQTGCLPGWLLTGASCRAGQRTFPGRSRGMFPACLDL